MSVDKKDWPTIAKGTELLASTELEIADFRRRSTVNVNQEDKLFVKSYCGDDLIHLDLGDNQRCLCVDPQNIKRLIVMEKISVIN